MTRSVLIADEDVQTRIIAKEFLRPRGLAVRFAADGAEACECICREDVALVVLDVDRPEMNGFDLLRRLHGRFQLLLLANRPRVLVVTARRDAAVKRFALQLGADAVLQKPLVPARFSASAQRLARVAMRPLSDAGPSSPRWRVAPKVHPRDIRMGVRSDNRLQGGAQAGRSDLTRQ